MLQMLFCLFPFFVHLETKLLIFLINCNALLIKAFKSISCLFLQLLSGISTHFCERQFHGRNYFGQKKVFSVFFVFLSRTWKLFWLKKKKVLLCCCCTWLWRETKINKAYFLLVCLLKCLLNNNFVFLWRCVLLFYCGSQV